MSHDTSNVELEAQHRFASELAQHGILVAKPYFDEAGGDLIAMLRVSDGARFVRIQSKGRTFQEPSSRASVTVKQEYVSESLCLLLYARLVPSGEIRLFAFFPEHIRGWNANNGSYSFSFSWSSLNSKWVHRMITSKDYSQLQAMIRSADMKRAFTDWIDVHLKARPASTSMSGSTLRLCESCGNRLTATGTERRCPRCV